jgi:GDP-L-fucose synthase
MKKNDKILITGSSGLLGSALVENLKEKKYKNLILINSKNVNLTNLNSIKKLITKNNPKYIFHCANKVFGFGGNQSNKFDMLNENLLINSNLLKAVINSKVKKILFVGSTAVYNEKLKYNISEDKIFYRKPHSSEYYYSLSKRIMLEQLLALKNFYNIPYVYVVMNNLYGPKDNFDIKTGHVVPSLIHKCLIAKKNNSIFNVWGSPNDKRCFLFSQDAAEALYLCMKQKKFNVINVGSAQEYKINDLVKIIKNELNFLGKIKWINSDIKTIKRRNIDLTRLKRTGFKEKWSLLLGIRKTILWLKSNYKSARK